MTEYLRFEREKQQEGRKTETWKVIAKNGGYDLGIICWYSPWRQYAFIPRDDSVVLNPDCLRTIADKAQALTHVHRTQLQSSRRSASVS